MPILWTPYMFLEKVFVAVFVTVDCALSAVFVTVGSAVFEIVARATDGKEEWTERECNY